MPDSVAAPTKVQRIQELNDTLRTTLQGGKVLMSRSVTELPEDITAQALTRMRAFTEFTGDNDPHGEHDFGSFEIDGRKFFFKIDYYDKECRYSSENPSDPAVTTRVLTLMLAEDY